MMPNLRRTRKRVVVPLAANDPSPVVLDPQINVPSVAAEVVVHCENSTEPRATAHRRSWKKLKILTRMNPPHEAFLNNQKKTILSPQQLVIVEMQELAQDENQIFNLI